MVRVMNPPFRDAKIALADIGHINAHGTSTVLNDKTESAALQTVFGERARDPRISSIKSMIGHLMAAAGAVELVATALSVFTGIIPPTINYEDPDPECPLSYVTQGTESVHL